MQRVDNYERKREKKKRGEGMRAVFRTDKGKVRQHNEDSGGVFLNLVGQQIAIVADGMGGHRAGDVASEMTVNKMKEQWEKTGVMETPAEAEMWLREHVLQVNSDLLDHSKSHSDCEGMGTTIVAVIITDLFATIAHIGDSRCYILNEVGFSQLTEDHSLVNELVRSGQISKEDAEHHPRKNVLTRALGTENSVEMDVNTIVFEEDDKLLLCSDGLSNKVTEKEMKELLQKNKTLGEKADSLINLANDYGGEDNITLIIVEFNPDGAQGDNR